jgi:hypothetical protein
MAADEQEKIHLDRLCPHYPLYPFVALSAFIRVHPRESASQ